MRALATLRSLYAVSAATILFSAIAAAQSPNKPAPATAAWWTQTVALSNDRMEGRDTGTDAYERAAKYVAAQFQSSGLKQAGDNGTYFQRVPMHEIDLDTEKSSVEIINSEGKVAALHFTTDVTTVPREQPSHVEAPLVFVGYGTFAPNLDLKGKIAVFFNNTPADLPQNDREPFNARRLRALAQAGIVAAISIDNPAATEPFHWPAAYARSVTLTGLTSSNTNSPIVIRINSASLDALFAASHHKPSDIIAAGSKGAPLEFFPLNLTAHINLTTTSKDISAPNVLAILPGSDPKLASEYVALSAHLDGYGYGTPVLGDNLYNGTLDDAAYVALLIELARDLQHKAPARSLLFCIFTGEEKGLLGSA
ncbi:MAG TPA: M28 family peptidase, partial [Edaphobacter sp.]|nr:M28 family peptidase [Edaphobacter sp.]